MLPPCRLKKLNTFIMSSIPSVKKRKVDLECRASNPEWKEKYFFIVRFGQAQCLICLKAVSVFKEFNVRRHWETEPLGDRAQSIEVCLHR